MVSNKPHIFDVIKIADTRGNLSVLQYPSTLPLNPVRVYWITDVPSGQMRLGHAYYSAQEVIVALSGSVRVTTQTAEGEVSRFTLSRPDQALFVPPMTWREIDNFATNASVLIATDTLYDEVDYIRNKDEFDRLSNDSHYGQDI